MPPKRKGDAIGGAEAVSDEAGQPVYRYNRHYRTLYLDMSHRVPYAPEVFTYEGVRLCHNCLQIFQRGHLAASRIGTCPLPVPMNCLPCEICKMPLKRSSNDKTRHQEVSGQADESICDISAPLSSTKNFWEPHPVYKTLVCPVCKIPGFDVSSIQKHFRNKECVGKKTFLLETKKTIHEKPVRCERCEYWFRASVFRIHVCGSDLDPVWLGRQDKLPDISKPYLVWGHELPPPHGPTGFGGGYIREDGQGKIPSTALEKSWAAPYASSPRFRDELIQQGDLFSLIRAVSRLLKDEGVSERSPDFHKYNTAWATALSKKEIGEKIETMRVELQQLQRFQNESLLSRCGITYDEVKDAEECQGFAWRHGSFACRHGSPINLGTVRLRSHGSREAVYLELHCCVQCIWDSAAINSWTRYSKFNGQGERLCTRFGCQRVLLTSIDCAEHDDERRKSTLERQVSRLERRRNEQKEQKDHQQELHVMNDRRRRRALWKVVSRGDMSAFYSSLADAQLPVLDEDWSNVKESLTTGDYHGPDVFYIDTESARILDQQSNKVLTPFELAILDSSGNVVVNTTIDYGKSVAELMQGCAQRFISKTCAIYGLQDANGKTHGMTPHQLRQKLREVGIGRDSILIEHSISRFDQEALVTICGQDTPQRSLTTFQLFKLLQYRGASDLQTMFHLTWPDSKLNVLHHRALWDVCKMLLILRSIFNRGVVEDSEVAGFLEKCMAFKEEIRERASKTRTGPGDVSYEGEEFGLEEESEESDWDPLELEDGD